MERLGWLVDTKTVRHVPVLHAQRIREAALE
jgi:hypothetical protein